jgi:hypothetical protein
MMENLPDWIDGSENQSVVKNSTAPGLILKEWHNAIAYHGAHETQAAAGIIKDLALEDGGDTVT